MPEPRLLLALTEFPPTFGGMQTHAVYLCRHLVERGYPIAVATYRHQDAEEFDGRQPFAVFRRLSRIGYWHNIDELAAIGAEWKADLIYSSTVFFGQAGERAGVPMVCRSAGNDVLRPWIAWPFSWMSRTLSTAWFEDFAYERFRRLDWPERLEVLMLERRAEVMRESANRMSRVLANSDFTAGLLEGLGLGGDRVRVLAGGVDARRFAPAFGKRKVLRAELGLPPKRYLLMTACRLVAKKGLELLISALPELRKRMRDVHLVVVGEGRDRQKCERLAASLGVADRVTFTGYVPHDELHRYYWCADQFVLASREHVHGPTRLRDVETMGRVLCEANAAGVPVAAARSGGIPSVIAHGENGLLFAESDTAGMTGCIQLLRDDPRLALRLIEEGLRRAEQRWDWSVVCRGHEDEMVSACSTPEPALTAR